MQVRLEDVAGHGIHLYDYQLPKTEGRREADNRVQTAHGIWIAPYSHALPTLIGGKKIPQGFRVRVPLYDGGYQAPSQIIDPQPKGRQAGRVCRRCRSILHFLNRGDYRRSVTTESFRQAAKFRRLGGGE